MLIFWAPSFVLSAGVPQFSIYEYSQLSRAPMLKGNTRAASCLTVASFLSNECASHSSLGDEQSSKQLSQISSMIYGPRFSAQENDFVSWDFSILMAFFQSFSSQITKVKLLRFGPFLHGSLHLQIFRKINQWISVSQRVQSKPRFGETVIRRTSKKHMHDNKPLFPWICDWLHLH